jgi:hypothetical protein
MQRTERLTDPWSLLLAGQFLQVREILAAGEPLRGALGLQYFVVYSKMPRRAVIRKYSSRITIRRDFAVE